MLARFSLDLNGKSKVVTGTWEEQTAKEGHYKGAIYQGAAQLILSDDGDSLKGKWVGFGKNLEVNTGDWEIVRTDEKTSGHTEG
jgi:hypothetical protein